MKAIIIQHEASSPPGTTVDWFQKNGVPFEILEIAKGAKLPPMNAFDLLVVCGGSMNVDQEHLFPWLKTEKAFIGEAAKANKKIVGLCLGGQLLAEVLGGSVQKHPRWEAGWQSVTLANQDELKVFQWHGYSFNLPPNAKLLASSVGCENQAFTYGQNILAFQFHPETTERWAIECSQDPELPAAEEFVQTPAEIQRDLKYQQPLQAWYFAQLNSLFGKSGG